ncbi:MAG: hypothetical protein H6876_01855 [Hyphomicrobiaceae bacterium]|nr:hypothetical protein [Hyphomicrobiaceae bacterium]
MRFRPSFLPPKIFTPRVVLSAWISVLCVSAPVFGPALADRFADIARTKHNLSVTGPGDVRSQEDRICVFCHTPHAANDKAPPPLWNRKLSGATYRPYESSSFDAGKRVGWLESAGRGQPGGASKLCLSCHDGTVALGSVLVLDGRQNQNINVSGTAPDGTIPEGKGASTGFTRRLGVDLTNDHPISFTFDDRLAAEDGELRRPSSTPELGPPRPGPDPELPLTDKQLQCTSCHDPHVRDVVAENIKFLRLNRFQEIPAVGPFFDKRRDQICLGCHEKEGWVDSAHAHMSVANETYTARAANLREFPVSAQVWRIGCLNCHDAHSVPGSRRLLREATDSVLTPKVGGQSAIEEGCYQCHSSTDNVLNGQNGATSSVPDIKQDFQSRRRMPIDERPEVHDIGTGSEPQPGKDFIESRRLLGRGNDRNRHVECTDCHNPHRVIRNRIFNASPTVPDIVGTRDRTPGVPQTNIASGVLRGSWGVEPVYGSPRFLDPPVVFSVKRGNPPVGGSTLASAPWVTREYQVCLKCHSTYGYTRPPELGQSRGGTPPGTNDVRRYTDQAMEFQAPPGDQGEPTTVVPGSGGPGGDQVSANHRSWHPVIAATGRTLAVRGGADANLWLPPWNQPDQIGVQTMYCSDCHGSETAPGTIIPQGGEHGRSWGPHGSNNNFILKGGFTARTGAPGTEGDICFKCHSYQNYATPDGDGVRSGFSNGEENLHAFHADKIGRMQCTWCHVAVPHGWKNKALLVNLNDVGPEGGLPPGTQVRNNTTAPYTNGPYYLGAVLKVVTFAPSGDWDDNNCGSVGPPGNGETGRDWMRDSSENCANPP